MQKSGSSLKREEGRLADYAGLFLIGILSFGYTLYSSRFAKIHLSLPLINAPLFIGDCVFAICFSLFLLKWVVNPKKFNPSFYLFLAYFGFVAVKTLLGYCHWGALSLRHSVLFFYPLFAVFSASFYEKVFFKPSNILVILTIFFAFFFRSLFFEFYDYASLTCFIITLVLINAYPKKPLKYLLYLLFFLLFPYKVIFNTSRTFMVSNLFAMAYLGLGFLVVAKKYKAKTKIILCFLIVPLIFYGISKHSSHSELKSIIGLSELKKKYNEETQSIRNAEPTFEKQKLGVKLYNDKTGWFRDPEKESGIALNTVTQRVLPISKPKKPSVPGVNLEDVSPGASYNQTIDKKKIKAEAVSENVHTVVTQESGKINSLSSSKEDRRMTNVGSKEKTKEPKGAGLFAEINKARDNKVIRERKIEVSYGNILFRVFIWQDALDDLKINHPIFGFDFGKPFRSHRLEVLRWGYSEWTRDGWICFHNSYIDIIYRAGIFGILMIISVFTALFMFIKKSFQECSFTGVLLTGALINWFIAANFLEILEMPYSAIPLWSLFGLTYAYLFKNKA